MSDSGLDLCDALKKDSSAVLQQAKESHLLLWLKNKRLGGLETEKETINCAMARDRTGCATLTTLQVSLLMSLPARIVFRDRLDTADGG